jgi:hypothetical protein
MKIILVIVIIISSWFYLMPYLRFFVSPFSWAETDIDKNGFVSPSEAGY